MLATDGALMVAVGAILSSVKAVDRLLAAAEFPAWSLAVPAGTVKAIVPLPLAFMLTVTVLPDGDVLTPAMLAVPVVVTFDKMSEVVKLMDASIRYGSV
jgi:hypothetical protein